MAVTKHDSLAAALAAFQAEVPKIEKSATADTGKYSYSYAPLDELVQIVLPLLAKNGMSFVAAPNLREDGQFVLRAELLHTSGDKVGGDYPLVNPMSQPQAIGSAITYARRYALTALTGVAPGGEDDDGAAAQKAAPAQPAAATGAPSGAETKTDIQREIGSLVDSGKISSEDANRISSEVSGKENFSAWTLADLKKIRTAVKEHIGE